MALLLKTALLLAVANRFTSASSLLSSLSNPYGAKDLSLVDAEAKKSLERLKNDMVDSTRNVHWSRNYKGIKIRQIIPDKFQKFQLRKLQSSSSNSGYLIADQFSNADCVDGSLKYSAVYQLGSCVSDGDSASFVYSAYSGDGAGFGVTFTFYNSTNDCSGDFSSDLVSYPPGCVDSVMYYYVPTATMVPQGVMFAQYFDTNTCSASGPNFYYATVVPLLTCYNGYDFAGCTATSYTYCRDDVCPTPLPTIAPSASPSTKPTVAPSALPSPNPSSTPSAKPTVIPTPLPTAKPSNIPSAIPTLSPTYATCGCGSYLDMNTDACVGCPENTYYDKSGAQSIYSCAICPQGTFSFVGSCQCSVSPEPISFPTASPISSPTAIPTSKPTTAPTFTPSFTPSSQPTPSPTLPPSFGPTLFPTPLPTAFPVAALTRSPTFSPSNKPTASPTYAPCACGSYFDTASLSCVLCSGGTYSIYTAAADESFCSICPTGKTSSAGACLCESFPTANPTFMPSEEPTQAPTDAPTPEPTVAPTFVTCLCGEYLNEKTNTCIGCPKNTYNGLTGSSSIASCLSCPIGSFSDPHSCSCSLYPTSNPISAPSAFPIADPTLAPIQPPSVSPTRDPTLRPSLFPSPAPSNFPVLPSCACGTFLDMSTLTCTDCSPGFYSALVGAIDGCVICPSGMSSNNGACSCSWLPTTDPTEAPISRPSEAPLSSPTVAPSKAPIPAPTSEPISVPTLSPTLSPTHAPISKPTKEPISEPTKEPIVSPTKNPIGTPTEHPSYSPTPLPTFGKCPCGWYLSVAAASCELCPANTYSSIEGLTSIAGCYPCGDGYISSPGSCACLNSPTPFPLAEPTLEPSRLPTLHPLVKFTAFPTLSPTQHPITLSMSPSAKLTLAPTNEICGCGNYFSMSSQTCVQCALNTYMPYSGSYGCVMCPVGSYSDVGSCNCSQFPSSEPTVVPTLAPTRNPSANPNAVPTSYPIASPTLHPVAFPTLAPTFLPTLEPSFSSCLCGSFYLQGSCVPCNSGTYMPLEGAIGPACISCAAGMTSGVGSCSCYIAPTAEPTLKPTGNPSVFPTPNPSTAPTHAPSKRPTFSPSPVPTLIPTFSPSSNPVATPTKNPTITPSSEPISSPTKNPVGTPTEIPTLAPSAVQTYPSCGCGTFYDIVGQICEACPYNTFSTTVGATSLDTCIACSKDTYSNGGACGCSSDPTPSPSVVPTLSPTLLPTKQPINSPTAIPTLFPVANPTLSPTLQPSPSPSLIPTALVCECGTYYSDVSGLCNACEAGTYMPLPGALGCVTCPAGTTSQAAACGCYNAPSSEPTLSPTVFPTQTRRPNPSPTNPPLASPTKAPIASPSYLPTNAPIATPCSCGYYMDNDICKPCPFDTYSPGYGAVSIEACVSCPASQYSDPGSCICTSNPTYQPISNPTPIPSSLQPTLEPTHTPCTCGSFLNTLSDGSSSCQLCAAGSYTIAGYTNLPTCFICPAGYTSNEGSCSCFVEPSAAPTHHPISHPTRRPIIFPTHMPIGTPTDIPVSTPTYEPTWTPCPCGQFVDLISGECIQCPSGLYSPGTGAISSSTCVACPNGLIASSDACYCYSGPTLYPTPNPSTLPTLNPTLSPSSDPTRKPTLHPTYAPSVLPTYDPTLQPTLFPTTEPCPCGYYSLTSGGECIICPGGSYMPYTGMFGCFICPPSFTSAPGTCSSTGCVPQPTAYPSQLPSPSPISAPTDYPIGRTTFPTVAPTPFPVAVPSLYPIVVPTSEPSIKPTLSPTVSPSYISCGCGQYLDSTTNTCISCPVNTYSPYFDGTDASFCSGCPLGYTSSVGACSCSPIPTSAPTAIPSKLPTPAPTITESCSVMSYYRCVYEDGFYLSSSCTVYQGVYEADDASQALDSRNIFLNGGVDAENHQYIVLGLFLTILAAISVGLYCVFGAASYSSLSAYFEAKQRNAYSPLDTAESDVVKPSSLVNESSARIVGFQNEL